MKLLKVYKIVMVDGKVTFDPTKPFWTAPFKTMDRLLREVQDYSERGFYCQIFESEKELTNSKITA